MKVTSIVLATTENVVRFYYYDRDNLSKGFWLSPELDMSRIPLFADRKSAAGAAAALGLRTWRYVGIH